MLRVFRVLVVIMIMAVSFDTAAQSTPTNYYSMDACDLFDDVGIDNGLFFGPDACACGVSANGLSFDGAIDFAEFDGGLNDVFRGDWSMTFYVQVLNTGTQSVDILHMGSSCTLDSVLSLRYLPGSQRFRFLFSNSENNSARVDGLADRNSCWQYIAVTKEQANLSIYVNGILSETNAAISDLAFDVPDVLKVANSPCLSIGVNPDAKFQGSLDEMRFFNRVLTDREIQGSYLRPDKIVTNDTTIFIGSSIRLQTGGSCFQDFMWTPDTDLSSATELNPIASPSADITYTLTVNGDNCQSVDEVTIRVADPSQVTCENLLLPSAFTPNNDQINDRYGISNRFLINQLLSFEIYNKWGGRVFFTDEPTGTWDGLYQGAPAPPNPYLYRVEYLCEGQPFIKTGTVNLIR